MKMYGHGRWDWKKLSNVNHHNYTKTKHRRIQRKRARRQAKQECVNE